MYFKQILDEHCGCASYVVASRQSHEAAIVDPRLFHEVTLAQKATALSDLCDHLRNDTGIQLAAGPSVADEKVTVFCEKLPLREVMRQLSRPFGYTWLRSGKQGDYHSRLFAQPKSGAGFPVPGRSCRRGHAALSWSPVRWK